MFGWFRPKCPVNPRQKVWIERRLAWLTKVFGLQRLRSTAVVLPTPEFFPEPYNQTRADVRVVLDRVCGCMGVPPGRVALDFFEGGRDGIEGAVGLYVGGSREEIHVKAEQLRDPVALVATLAHELGHALLLGDGRLSREESDHEQVTDLLTVFLGLGLFSANSVFRESYTRTPRTYSWRMQRQGYLTEPMYAYALALFAWARGGEEDPDWSSYLRPDVRSLFWKGFSYLRRTGDSLFQPGQAEEASGSSAEQIARLGERLASPFSGTRVAALQDLREIGAAAHPAEPVVRRALRDADPFVRSEAARVLAAIGPAARGAVAALVELALLDEQTEPRRDAVLALAAVGQQEEGQVVPALTALLRAQEPALRLEAVRALRVFGPAAVPAIPALVEMLNEPEDVAEEAVATLGAMGPAAAAAVPALLRLLEDDIRTLDSCVQRALRLIQVQSYS